MIRILSMLFLVLLVDCGYAQSNMNQLDDKGRKQGLWKKELANGNLLYEGHFKNDQPVGEFKRYHTNGLLKARLIYSEKSDTTVAELYDLRGKLMAKGNYLNQQKEGLWKYFQKDQLVSEEHFIHDKKNGISKTYYQTGELFEETTWVDDQKTGVYRAYFKSGSPYLECMMLNGKRNGTCLVYYENGKHELDALYEQGLRNGEWRYYHENGDFSHQLAYDTGTLLNPQVLDSIQQIQFNQLEQNKDKLVDPEKFMNDPMQYMIKNNMLHQ